jgi:hypothetical protein
MSYASRFLFDTCGTKLMYVYVLSQNVCMKGFCYALCFSFKISTHLGGVTHMRIFTLFGYLVFSITKKGEIVSTISHIVVLVIV